MGLHDGVAGSLNFTDQFGDFGVQASGGILWAQGFSGGANGDDPDLYAYNAGAQFSFAGFSVGGGWVWVPQGQRGVAPANGAGIPTGAPVKLNGLGWTVGGAYEFGPYKIGVTYQYGDNNKTSTGGKDRLDQAVLSGTYTLGPGIRLVGGVMYYNWEEENKMSQNEGIGGLTGVKIGF